MSSSSTLTYDSSSVSSSVSSIFNITTSPGSSSSSSSSTGSKITYSSPSYSIKSKNTIITKEQIFDKIWGFDSETSTNVIEVYASGLRKELKKRNIKELKVVYSKEIPKTPKDNSKNLGSISFVPSVAGLIIAGEVVRDILGIDKNI